MMRLARAFTFMSVCLWAQSGWACVGYSCFVPVTDDSVQVTSTAGVVWLGATSYHISKSSGVADTEEKSVPEPSSLGLRDFQYRFEANRRGMSDGLLRASGVEYNWVVSKLLGVSPVKQPLFKCLLLSERSTLKARLGQAKSRISIAYVYDWLVHISQRVKNEQDLRNRC